MKTHFDLVTRTAQRGIALLMALVALVAMSLTAMALIRSVDTGNVIAGNVAFKQTSSQAVDVGLESAFSYLTATLSAADLSANQPPGCTTNCNYYATRQPVNYYDIPSAVTWDSVATVDTSGLPSINGVYKIQFVIDRLCSVTNVKDFPAQCLIATPKENCRDPNKAGESGLCPGTDGVYYRATVYVTGPRNSKTYTQSTFVRY